MKNQDDSPRIKFLRLVCGHMWAIQFIFVLNLAIVILLGLSLYIGSPTQETVTISTITAISSIFAIAACLVLAQQCRWYHYRGESRAETPSREE